MAHLIANTFIQLLLKDIPTSPLVGKKCPMAIVSKPESYSKESLQNDIFWTDTKELFNSYFTFFSVEDCYLNLSADIVE